MPEAAKAHTQDGAKAFVEFYWRMLGELDKHPRAGVIPKFAASSCKACAMQNTTIEGFVRDGSYIVDSNPRMSDVQVRPDSSTDSIVVQSHQTDSGAARFRSGRQVEKLAPVDAHVEMRADWAKDRWVLGEEGSLAH